MINLEDIESGIMIMFLLSFIWVEGFENDCNVVMVIIVGEMMDVVLIIENMGVVLFEFNCVLYIYFYVDYI